MNGRRINLARLALITACLVLLLAQLASATDVDSDSPPQEQEASDDNASVPRPLPAGSGVGGGKCEPITVPMCRQMPYNSTSMPNQFNHYTQQEAAMEAHQFWALVEINCSPDLRFLLCSMYTPICMPATGGSGGSHGAATIRACRSVCLRARNGCEQYMRKFGFEWPEHMSCERFPEHGSPSHVCMDPVDAVAQHINANAKLTINHQLTNMPPPNSNNNNNNVKQLLSPDPVVVAAVKQQDDDCTDNNNNNNNNAFSQEERAMARSWLLTWSLLCTLSSVCTAATYAIDRRRFAFPEKAIIYMSVCYLFVSVGYLLPLLLTSSSSTHNCAQTATATCALSFALVYYFATAASIWWMLVALTWFLAAGLKWSSESLGRYAGAFHALAWIVPAIQTGAALMFAPLDRDPLSGLYQAGARSVRDLRVFFVAPGVVYLALGVAFLVAGFVSLARLRRTFQLDAGGGDDAKQQHKLDKLMIRVGVFSILYTVPASCVLACQLYEQMYRDEWQRTGGGGGGGGAQPSFALFMLKYAMSVIVGVTAGFWIWTKKSVRTWRAFCHCSPSMPRSSHHKSTGGDASTTTATTTGSNSMQHQQQKQQQRPLLTASSNGLHAESIGSLQSTQPMTQFYQPQQQQQQPQHYMSAPLAYHHHLHHHHQPLPLQFQPPMYAQLHHPSYHVDQQQQQQLQQQYNTYLMHTQAQPQLLVGGECAARLSSASSAASSVASSSSSYNANSATHTNNTRANTATCSTLSKYSMPMSHV